MSEKIKKIIEDIEALEEKLKNEITEQETNVNYKIKDGYVRFEKEVVDKHKEKIKNIFTYLGEIPILKLISSPVVYFMVVPAIILDIMLFIYQQVIFRIYKFELIKRSDYIVYDRQYLAYLNPIEKINCMYCSYFNGLMHYASEISSKTELYFCPIKHAKKIAYKHRYYKDFLVYGDERDYQEKLEKLRETIEKSTLNEK